MAGFDEVDGARRAVTVAERLRSGLASFTPSERRVARALLADYPLAALEPVATLAARAGVSGPTVTRFVSRLGFASYPSLQRALKDEVSARLSSPLRMYARATETGQGAEPVLHRAGAELQEAVAASLAALAPTEFDAAVELLTDERRRVVTIGGRFSSMLGHYLASHLRLLRAGVEDVPAAASDRTGTLLDVGRRHVVVAFDYRRYQRDTIRFGTAAKEQGAAVVLFTDPYLSPLAAHADVVLPTIVAGPSPFDALTPAMALVEILIAALVERLGPAPRDRIARYDALNDQVAVDGGRDIDLSQWEAP